MTTALEQRLQQIEARLQTLEVAVRVPLRPTAPSAQPVAPPPPLPPAARRRPARPPPKPPAVPAPSACPARPERDWERFFGIAVLGRIGVAAVLLAASYFAKLAYDEMSDVLKVGSIYLLAAAFLATGWFLRKRVTPRYVALLWGGGAAAAYLAGLAAHLRYGLVGTTGGLALLLGASALGQALAHKLRHKTLSVIALAGAFAAPLFVVFPLSERAFPLDASFLLVYLLTLYAWSAWMERAWGWTSARTVGYVGTICVAAVWLFQAGALDTSTYVHVHLYLLGLALPEMLLVAWGQRIPRERLFLVPGGVALAETALLLSAGGPFQASALPAFAALAGGLWLTIAALLSPPARKAAALHFVRGFARVGTVLLAFGLLHFSEAILGRGTLAQTTWTVLGLSALTYGAFALRRVVSTADIGAATAATLAAFVVLQSPDPSTVLLLAPLAVAALAALVVLGHRRLTRGFGFWIGLLTVFFALLRADQWDHAWQAAALAGAALWSAAVMAGNRTRADRALELQGTLALWLLGLLWVPLAFLGHLAQADTPLLNPGTAAAAVIAAVAAWGALRHRRRETDGIVPIRLALWALSIGILLVAGQRETAEAVAGLAAPIRAALYVLYLSTAGVVCAALGRWRAERGLLATGLLLALGGVARALLTATDPALGAWAMLELLAPVGALLLIGRLAGREQRFLSLGCVWGLALAGFTWCLYALEGRLPHHLLLLNVRFLTGAALVSACALLPRCTLFDRAIRSAGLALITTVVLLSYLMGLAELLDTVARHADILGGAWPAVLVSVYSTLAAAVLLIVGFRRRDRRLRYAALLGFGAVVLKIGFYDLQAASLPLRIFVTGLLGLVLLAAAFAYARRSGGAQVP